MENSYPKVHISREKVCLDQKIMDGKPVPVTDELDVYSFFFG